MGRFPSPYPCTLIPHTCSLKEPIYVHFSSKVNIYGVDPPWVNVYGAVNVAPPGVCIDVVFRETTRNKNSNDIEILQRINDLSILTLIVFLRIVAAK